MVAALAKENKPSLDDQYKVLSVNYLNNLELRYKGGSGGEEITAIEALKLLINYVEFVYGYHNILG